MRRTALRANEYRRNFRQVDCDAIAAVTSVEAGRVTPLMTKIYMRLVAAPAEFWESPGVLYFAAKEEGARMLKASKVLYEVLGVASATAHKALQWMHEEGVIGYFAGKNGAGIRIFLNRAASSIGLRDEKAGKKILPFAHGSNYKSPGSAVEPAFNDSFAVLREVLDKSLNPDAPKNGADKKGVDEKVSQQAPSPTRQARTHPRGEGREAEHVDVHAGHVSVEKMVERLKNELEPCMRAAAAQAAAQATTREMARTREWFETKALPKAVRVAQHETYGLFRKHGRAERVSREAARSDREVERPNEDFRQARPLTPEEIRETAESCAALWLAQGRSIEVTLSELSSEGGGWLLPRDAPRVRELAESLVNAERKGGDVPGAHANYRAP